MRTEPGSTRVSQWGVTRDSRDRPSSSPTSPAELTIVALTATATPLARGRAGEPLRGVRFVPDSGREASPLKESAKCHKRTTVARTTEFKARHPPKSSDASQSANDNGLLGVGLVVRHVIVRSYLLNDPRSKFRAANAVGSIASESARTVHKFLPTTRCFLYRAWPESFCTN